MKTLAMLAALLAMVACAGPASTDADAAVDVADDARVPIAEVTFELNAPPAAPQYDLSAWLDGGFCTMDERQTVSCPDLVSAFACTSVSNVATYAAWLDPAVPPLLCDHWCLDDAGGCVDGDGVVGHRLGLVIDYLLVLDDGVPAAVRTPAEFVARYAPVDSPGKALSFAAFLVPRAYHKFWPLVSGTPPSDVSWQDVADESCASATIEGTTVTPIDDGYRVSTFRGPDWNGCTDLALERLVVTVSRAGVVQVESATPLCWGSVPCYD